MPFPGKLYYGPSLSNPTEQPTLWSNSPSRDFLRNQYHPARTALGLGLVGLGIAGAGTIPLKGRGRVWDYYVKAIRGAEEYSPGGILRTFQLSNFFSQYETATQDVMIHSNLLQNNPIYAQYLHNLLGGGNAKERLLRQGVHLKNGRLFWGNTQEVALKYARGIRSSPYHTASWIGKSWAAMTGIDPFIRSDTQSFFTKEAPDLWQPNLRNPTAGGMAVQIIGAKSRLGMLGKHTNALATEWVGRFNRLLQKPAELPIVGSAFHGLQKATKKYLGRELDFSVKSGTGREMMTRLVGKYGLILPAAFLGYKTLDWGMNGSRATKGSIFEEGLTTGIATAAVKAHIGISRLAEITGLHRYREKQEEVAPGSTSLQKLIAFPIIGSLTAEGGLYANKLYKMARLQASNPAMESWQAREIVEEGMKNFGGKSIVARSAKYLARSDGLFSDPGRMGNIWRRIAEKTGQDTELSFKLLGRMTPVKFAGTVGMLAGIAAVLPFVPGALIPGQRPDELKAEYSGQKEVAIRQGRWWEMGRSFFEGTKVSYYRPNWYAKMRMHARDTSIWGNADLKNKSPIRRWIEQEFSYNLEKKHYQDRPYPITALPFQDVPFIGPLLANTVGRLIKPPKLMHTEEWQGKGGMFKQQPPRFGERVATEMSEQPPSKPISPYDIRATIGEEWMRTYEMAGLPGFMASTIKNQITGSGDIFDQMSQLENARRMFGFERQYYESELGGALGMSEAFRRLYPHRNRGIPLYNPIANTMPDWLPGPGEKSPDFLHGDPYTKVAEGELRLPGEGYAQRFPELAGIKPADYPLIHRWKILADVAPYSEQYGQAMQEIRVARKHSAWTPAQEQIYQTTIEQIASRKQKKQFQEYQYLSPMGHIFSPGPQKEAGDSTNLIGTLNRIKADQQEKPSTTAKLFGGYWELLSHNAETVMDQLTPMSPGAKLVHQRTAIEDYERTRLYGSENAFWGHPVRDFLRPTTALAMHDIGYQGVPSHIQSKRNLEAYFDVLKYVKNTRLANVARLSNDYDSAKQFEAKKDQTLFGINPYTMNYTSIFNALPRKERDYFNAFVAADTSEERTRILQMVPENEKALYAARWKLTFADEVKKASKAGKLTEDQMSEAENLLSHIYNEAHTEGMPNSKELQAQYITGRQKGESYGDWYRRTHLLTQLKNLPGPDWVGYHPSVDLDDIKLRLLQTTAEDMHDYDLWESRQQSLANKPYINQEAIAPLVDTAQLSQADMHARIDELLSQNNLQGDVFVRGTPTPDDTIDVDVQTSSDQFDITKAG